MLANVREETFASNLSKGPLDPGWEWTMGKPEEGELGDQRSILAREDKLGPKVFISYVCEDAPQAYSPDWTVSVQISPDLQAYSRNLLCDASVITGSSSVGRWSYKGARNRRTHTDDGCTSLKGDASPVWTGTVRYYTSGLLPKLAEVVDSPTREQEAVEWIKEATGLSWTRVSRLLGITRQAINAWRHGKPLRDDHRQRLFEIREVLERAAKRNPRPRDLSAWLDMPRGANAESPADLLEAGEIGKVRLLAVTSPSPKVKAPSKRTRDVALKAYEQSRERVRALPTERDEELLAEMSDEE